MIRTSRRMVAGVVMAAALAGPVDAEAQVFDMTLGALRVGVLELDSPAGREGQSARLSIRSAGLAGLVRAVRFEAHTTGTNPRRYEEEADTGRRVSQVRIDWLAGRPQVLDYTAIPSETAAPPDAAATEGTLDPVSAAFAVLRDLPRDQLCDKTLMVFDGSRLSRLRLEPARDAGATFTCEGKYARVEGEAHSLSSQREFPFQLVYAEQPDGVGRLQRIETRTNFGVATLERRS